jgi:hypothetical protein
MRKEMSLELLSLITTLKLSKNTAISLISLVISKTGKSLLALNIKEIFSKIP